MDTALPVEARPVEASLTRSLVSSRVQYRLLAAAWCAEWRGASASYDGFVTTIQHRMGGTFSFLANHTWPKCLDIEDAQGDIAAITTALLLRLVHRP
jgi:hypothetical protein